MREKGIILEHQAEAAFVRRHVAQVLPLPQHRARFWLFEPGDDAQDSALAGAGGAQQADQFALVHLKTDTLEEGFVFVILHKVFYFEHQNNSSPGRRIFSINILPSPQTSSSSVDIANA